MKPIEKRPKQSRKRSKISSCVVTDEALVAELERDEEDRRQKEEDKLRRKDLRDAKKVAKLEAEKVKV